MVTRSLTALSPLKSTARKSAYNYDTVVDVTIRTGSKLAALFNSVFTTEAIALVGTIADKLTISVGNARFNRSLCLDF
jgi:hypothetical protein